MNCVQVLLLFLVLKVVTIAGDDWVDPYSMNTNVKYNLKKMEVTPCLPDTELQPSCNSPPEIGIYFQRLIRLLLNNAVFKHELDVYYGTLNIQLSTEDFDVLSRFAKDKNPLPHHYKDAQSVLEEAFYRNADYEELVVPSFVFAFWEKFETLIQHPLVVATIVSALIVFCIYMGWITWRRLLFIALVFVYIIDSLKTYYHLVEEEEIANMVLIKSKGGIPPDVIPRICLGWNILNIPIGLFSETDCAVYHKAFYTNSQNMITPLKVFDYQLNYLITSPLRHLGTGLGQFVNALASNLPFGFSIILFPLMLILFLLVFLIALLVFSKQHSILNPLVSLFQFIWGHLWKPTSHSNTTAEIDRGHGPVDESEASPRPQVQISTPTNSPAPSPSSAPPVSTTNETLSESNKEESEQTNDSADLTGNDDKNPMNSTEKSDVSVEDLGHDIDFSTNSSRD